MIQYDVAYWRTEAEQCKKNYQVLKEELDEFQLQSRDLEKEMEVQLEQLEKRNLSLTVSNERLLRERDSLREKLEDSQSESVRHISRVEEQLNMVTGDRDQLQKYIRELEQTNDDLERAQRNVSAMVDEFEQRMNETLERNVLLEAEIDEKNTLKEYIQRLKEELRDLKQEMNVREMKYEKMIVTKQENNNGAKEGRKSRTQSTPTPPRFSSNHLNLSPSNRISALNIVGDLLRKVGALESKFPCRKSDSNGGPQPKQQHLSKSRPSKQKPV